MGPGAVHYGRRRKPFPTLTVSTLMTDLPFFSVIVPTHNRLALLQQTLSCLAQQNYPREKYEVVVIDNGSTDGTAVYLQARAQQGQVHYICQPALGPAVARNVGAKAARGDILAFTDDDCLPDPQWLAALAAAYGSDPNVAAVGGRVENVHTGEWLHDYYLIQDERQLHPTVPRRYLDTANASFRQAAFRQVGGFQERFHFPAAEDVEMGYRLTAAGYTLHFAPQALVWHQGRTSLRGILAQSWRRGLGQAMLMAEYPQHYFAQARPGWRSALRQQLDQLVRHTFQKPAGIRPFLCAIATTIRTLLYLPPQIKFLRRTRYTQQIARIRGLDTSSTHRLYFFLLLAADNFLRLAGQVAGTFSHTYRQVQQNQEPQPLYLSHVFPAKKETQRYAEEAQKFTRGGNQQ